MGPNPTRIFPRDTKKEKDKGKASKSVEDKDRAGIIQSQAKKCLDLRCLGGSVV